MRPALFMKVIEQIRENFRIMDRLSVSVDVDPEVLLKMLTTSNHLSDLTTFRLLFRLKNINLPSSFSRRGCANTPFQLLSKEGQFPIIIGLQGQFWKWNPELRTHTPTNFINPENTNETQVIWLFDAKPGIKSGKCTLTKELWTRSFTPLATQKFDRYWRRMKHTSKTIRYILLLFIKFHVERKAK